MAGFVKSIEAHRLVVETEQHQRRIERQRRERVCCKAEELSRPVHGRYDRDSGREAAERVAQCSGIEVYDRIQSHTPLIDYSNPTETFRPMIARVVRYVFAAAICSLPP